MINAPALGGADRSKSFPSTAPLRLSTRIRAAFTGPHWQVILPEQAISTSKIQIRLPEQAISTSKIQIRVDEPTVLVVPVLAELDYSPGDYLLTDIATGIFGVGSSPDKVVKDFLKSLRDHADVLSRAKAPLSPQLQKHLVYLRSHLAS